MTEKDQFVTEALPPRPDVLTGTVAHYSDAAYYDRAYKRYKADIDFYLQVALEHGGPILELGCGTGRVTIPLARAGFEVHGVDLSAPMLEAAADKVAAESDEVRSRITLCRGDIRRLSLKRTFRLILSPFNVLQHLYTRDDIERCFDVVKRHLMPRVGRFVFDVLMPDVRALSRNPTKQYKMGQLYHPAGDKRYFYRESFDYDPMTQVEFITMYFDDPDDPEQSFETPLAHRQFFPLELEGLLHYNGFDPLECYGAFDREELQEDSDSQIYVCKLASSSDSSSRR